MKKFKITLSIISVLALAVFAFKFYVINSNEFMKMEILKLYSDSFETYNPTILPDDTTKLFVEDGNTESDTVILYVQGGPMPNLGFTFLKDSVLNELPVTKSYKRIYVHQSQTYNTSIINSADKLTFENAKLEADVSSEILYRSIDYFKKRDKKVVLLAHSYGSFIIPNCLASNPNIADKIVLMAGRLDINDEVWQSLSNGVLKGFEQDGVTVVEGFGVQQMIMYLLSSKVRSKMSAMSKMAAGIGYKRFTSLLKAKDLSNLLYIYGALDSNLGSLNSDEVNFLENKDVRIIKMEGGHSSMFGLDTFSKISSFIRN